MIGVLGTGVVGERVVDVAGRHGLDAGRFDAAMLERFDAGLVVVVATGGQQCAAARELVRAGVDVVCTSDGLDDVIDLLELDAEARRSGSRVVVGAAASPGLTALVARRLSERLDAVDEVHVAAHGTGGPACARQHHRALAGESIGWHDGAWLRRPGGSGRELCWFPEPIGAYDCYRAEMADPILLRRALPHLCRVTARMSATRRDRLTSRLPMLVPPNPEGGLGAIRVEVRGFRLGSRVAEVAGVVGRLGQLAAGVACATAQLLQLDRAITAGCHVLGASGLPNERLLDEIIASGVVVEEFVGS